MVELGHPSQYGEHQQDRSAAERRDRRDQRQTSAVRARTSTLAMRAIHALTSAHAMVPMPKARPNPTKPASPTDQTGERVRRRRDPLSERASLIHCHVSTALGFREHSDHAKRSNAAVIASNRM